MLSEKCGVGSPSRFPDREPRVVITNSLMVVTMGIAFYFIPLLLSISTLLFVWRWRATSVRYGDDDGHDVPKDAIKDPLIVAGILGASGIAMVAFLTGRFSLADYLSVPVDTLGVLGDAVIVWEDPLSSHSIALRGGVFIALASTIVVCVTLISYYRGRLHYRDKLAKSPPRKEDGRG